MGALSQNKTPTQQGGNMARRRRRNNKSKKREFSKTSIPRTNIRKQAKRNMRGGFKLT